MTANRVPSPLPLPPKRLHPTLSVLAPATLLVEFTYSASPVAALAPRCLLQTGASLHTLVPSVSSHHIATAGPADSACSDTRLVVDGVPGGVTGGVAGYGAGAGVGVCAVAHGTFVRTVRSVEPHFWDNLDYLFTKFLKK